MGTLGDGLTALRALALKGHPVLLEGATLQQKLYDELTYEAQKFFVYRAWRMMDRELLSLHRLRSLTAMLKHAA